MTDIHSCSYYCERPDCIKRQRDELRDKLFGGGNMTYDREENEMKPHKHEELIKAWADGHTIQLKRHDGWVDEINPSWSPVFNYRIKPAEKVVRWLWAWQDKEGSWKVTAVYLAENELNHALPYDCKARKLEWSREEFEK